MLVFVYGTLKRNGSNHHCLADQRFIGDAATKPLFRLYDLGGYPGMVSDFQTGVSVSGEVWEVDASCLKQLDLLEDTDGGEYVREIMPLEAPFEAQVIEGYRYLRSVAGRRDLGSRW
ncbi:MAG: gamma-glutamylcyclotransferase family protein [Prosthecobacter sp.]|nr:gamma-glutamylcyclotransferase family protein [Prosthecobacter sp.]